MGLLKKVNEVLVGAVAGGYQLVIPYVVAGVLKGRVEAGIDPQGVTAETLDIIQFGGHAGNIANAVCIGVHKALGVDFVKYGVVKPGCCHSRSLPFVIEILGLQPKTILAYGWAKICPGGKFFEKRNRTGSVGTGPVSKQATSRPFQIRAFPPACIKAASEERQPLPSKDSGEPQRREPEWTQSQFVH